MLENLTSTWGHWEEHKNTQSTFVTRVTIARATAVLIEKPQLRQAGTKAPRTPTGDQGRKREGLGGLPSKATTVNDVMREQRLI